MRNTLIIVGLVLGSVFGCDRPDGKRIPHEPDPYANIVEKQGWTKNYMRGTEILRELAELSSESRNKLDIAAYCGEQVAFVGSGGVCGNDLITEGGFYLRVVNKAGKDLRPQSVLWEVLIRGEIQRVRHENKLIVLEVDEKDWLVLQTW